MHRLRALACLLGPIGLAFALGCQPEPAEKPMAASRDAAEPDALEADASPIEPRCTAPAGVPVAPHSIAEVVQLINALPKPVTLPCFLDALLRPLSLHAVKSSFSAQPADGARSPRIFIFYPGIILSIVPSGPGAHLLELGEWRPDDRSLKAELELPIDAQLDEAAPFERVFFDDAVTTCGFCHQGEERDEALALPLAFVSPAIRPRDEQRVWLDELALEAAACDASEHTGDDPDAGSERERCAILHALFDRAPLPIEHEFPPSYRQF